VSIALAELLAPGSRIHALDRIRSVLQDIPAVHKGIRLTPHVGDFSRLRWPFVDVDGILMRTRFTSSKTRRGLFGLVLSG
jgi:hypothetical protein